MLWFQKSNKMIRAKDVLTKGSMKIILDGAHVWVRCTLLQAQHSWKWAHQLSTGALLLHPVQRLHHLSQSAANFY